jgi:hypothetical protein
MEDWYPNIHIRDALHFGGLPTGHQFRLAVY